jgi:phosphoglucomutase
MKLIQQIKQAEENEELMTSTVANLRLWLEAEELPTWVSDSLGELITGEHWDELNDRFYKDISFGTGGMRGRTIGNLITSAEKGEANKEGTPERPMIGSNAMNDFTVVRSTMALYEYVSKFLEKNDRFETPTVAIAHDVRHFSRRFCLLAASVWSHLGGIPLIFDGPRSTPHLSFTVRRRKAHVGIVITASHNPPHDNGFKAYFEDGAQVITPHAEGIVEAYGKISLQKAAKYLDCENDGARTLPKEDDTAYLRVVEQAAIDPEVIEQAAPKIVFTPIHGTGAISSIPVLWELGLEPIMVDSQNKMDPNFPTVESPNPENAEALKEGIALAKKTGAIAVIATDPDGDRMGVASRDEKKNYVLLNGNEISAVMAEYRISRLKEFSCLPENGSKRATIIKTFVTSPLIDAIAEGHGLNCVNTLTGFKWAGQKIRQYEEAIKKELLDNEGIAINYDDTDYYSKIDAGIKYGKAFIFACEESYGYLPYDFARDKDANASIIAYCEILSYLKSKNTTILKYLDNIYLKYGYYDQETVNIYYEGATGSKKINNIINSYKSDPPESIFEQKVIKHHDFEKPGKLDEDNCPVPIEKFHVFELENKYSVAVRASGTEPKIKFYIFGREIIKNSSELNNVKSKVFAQLERCKLQIEEDAERRSIDPT